VREGRRSYLATAENKTERSRDRPERTEGTYRVSHPTEQFGRGGHSRLAVRFLVIRGGAWFGGLVWAGNLRTIIRKGRCVYIVRGNIRGSDQNNHVHVLSGFPPYEIEGVDGER